MSSNIPYNGNPTSAVNQYNANKSFSDNVDKANGYIEISKKITPQLSKSLEFTKDVLTCMKSDTEAVILFSKLLIKLASENPIGKLVFQIYEFGFDTMFKMLLVSERIQDIRAVLDVFEEFVDNSKKAYYKLFKFEKHTYLQGPFTFALKKMYDGGITLDDQQSKHLLNELNNTGRQIVAVHDVLLAQLVPGSAAIYDFVNGIKNPTAKTMIDQLGNNVIDKDLEWFQLFLAQENFSGLQNAVLQNRNNWAQWCGLSSRGIEYYKSSKGSDS